MTCPVRNDAGLAAMATGDAPLDAHTRTCPACSAVLEDFRRMVSTVPRADGKPEAFWSAQRDGVRRRLAGSSPRRRWAWTLAPTLAGAFVAALWLGGRPSEPPDPAVIGQLEFISHLDMLEQLDVLVDAELDEPA